MTRLKIHHLSEGRTPHAVIAAEVGCCERTVFNVLQQPKPTTAELVADRPASKGPGAPSKTEAFSERVLALLKERPRLPTVELLRQARGWGYGGGDSAFFELVKRLRPPPTPIEPEVRFEGLPGEFAQFDFGEVKLEYGDGSKDKVTFFVGRLKFSRVLHVEVTPDQTAESLARATVACLNAFGGAPKQWVYDNPKTVWADAPGGRKVLHPYLRQLTAEFNALIEPCTPRMANQKGSVENGVGFAKKNFFLAYGFADRADLLRQLPQWLHRITHERPCDATDEVPAKRWEQERPRLNTRPVPWSAEDFPLHESGVVSPTGSVRYRGTAYSVDPRFLGAPATLLVGAKRIVIHAGKSQCEHDREDFTDEVRRLPEHSLAFATLITAERKQTYFKRQCLLELGPAAQQFLDRLIMRAPGNSWYADIHALFGLYQTHDHASVLDAMAEGVAARRVDVAFVRSQLREVV